MAFGTRAQLETLRELAYTSVSASYVTVGTPLTDHARIICFNNSTDVDIYITDDGTNNKIRLAANSFRLIDYSTNKIRDDGLFVSIGTQFSAKQVSGAPTRGAVWIEVTSATGGV